MSFNPPNLSPIALLQTTPNSWAVTDPAGSLLGSLRLNYDKPQERVKINHTTTLDLTYLLTPAFLTFVQTCVVIFLPATYFHIRRHHSLHCHQKRLWNCDNSSNRLQLPSPTMHVCIIITSLVWISLLLSSLQLPLYSHNLAAVLGLIAVNAPFFSSLLSVGANLNLCIDRWWMLPGLRLGGGILIIHQSVSSIYLVISFCVIFIFFP